jgi:hypothetical protein
MSSKTILTEDGEVEIAVGGGEASSGRPPWASSPSSSAIAFRGQPDDHIAAAPIVAWPAPSPSSPAPAARRCAASGLDRSVRPSKLVVRAAAAGTSMYSNPPSQKSLTQNF